MTYIVNDKCIKCKLMDCVEVCPVDCFYEGKNMLVIKPEIKKVKKQHTEKREYKIKDYVVYPKHGVGQITEFKKINIGGIDVETYIIKFEKDKANGMVPVNKQSHLRLSLIHI